MKIGKYQHKPNQGFQNGNKFGAMSFLGKKHTEETKKKIKEKRKKQIFTLETRKKLSEVHRGEKGSNWKGGATLLGGLIRSCFKYRQWRSDVFTRDDFTCQECGKRGGDLEAHHIKEFSIIMRENKIKTTTDALACEELWNINNGRTLCLKCHNKTKTKLWRNFKKY